MTVFKNPDVVNYVHFSFICRTFQYIWVTEPTSYLIASAEL